MRAKSLICLLFINTGETLQPFNQSKKSDLCLYNIHIISKVRLKHRNNLLIRAKSLIRLLFISTGETLQPFKPNNYFETRSVFTNKNFVKLMQNVTRQRKIFKKWDYALLNFEIGTDQSNLSYHFEIQIEVFIHVAKRGETR